MLRSCFAKSVLSVALRFFTAHPLPSMECADKIIIAVFFFDRPSSPWTTIPAVRDKSRDPERARSNTWWCGIIFSKFRQKLVHWALQRSSSGESSPLSVCHRFKLRKKFAHELRRITGIWIPFEISTWVKGIGSPKPNCLLTLCTSLSEWLAVQLANAPILVPDADGISSTTACAALMVELQGA